MAYASWSVVFGEQPSAAKWNILGTNDASFNDGTGIGAVLKNSNLSTTAGDLGGLWGTFSPTWTNLTTGNGTVTANYIQIGKTVFYNIYLLWGTTTSISGAPQFTLPVTSTAVNGTVGDNIGLWKGLVAGNQWDGVIAHIDTTHGGIRAYTVSGSNIKEATIGASSPDAWTTASEFHINGFYRVA